MITLAQLDTQIDAAWTALRVNEIEYSVNGRMLKFRTLDEMQRHINWLLELKQTLTATADVAAGDPVCPVVQYQDSE